MQGGLVAKRMWVGEGIDGKTVHKDRMFVKKTLCRMVNTAGPGFMDQLSTAIRGPLQGEPLRKAPCDSLPNLQPVAWLVGVPLSGKQEGSLVSSISRLPPCGIFAILAPR